MAVTNARKVDPSSEEHKKLHRYFHGHSIDEDITAGPPLKIFRIWRHHERWDSRTPLSQSTGAGQRRLLWHGSPIINFLSILIRGLGNTDETTVRKCYNHSPQTWCAASSATSLGYCQRGGSASVNLMLLFEVCQSTFTNCENIPIGQVPWRDAGSIHSDLQGIDIVDHAKDTNYAARSATYSFPKSTPIRLRYLFMIPGHW